MLVVCLLLFVALLVGLPSNVSAQTLDHQQLDISGALGTNPASPIDFGDKQLSKHPTRCVDDPPEDVELTSLKVSNSETVIIHNLGLSASKYEVKNLHNLGTQNEARLSSNIKKRSENVVNNSYPCPEPADIAPCLCSITGTSDLLLDCSLVESYDQLAEVFRKDFPFKQFYEFRMHDNYNIQYLSDFFNGVSFAYFHMSLIPNLKEISTYAFFDSRNSLENIYIHISALDENTFPFSILKEYPNLTSIFIGESNIEIIPVIESSSIERVAFPLGSVSALPAGE